MMKEQYASPAAELLRFTPEENLAASTTSPADIDFGNDNVVPDLVIDIGKLL